LFHDVQNAVSGFTSQAQKIISNAGQTIKKDLSNIPKAAQSGLAEAYHATRQGLTNLFLYSGAAGQEVGNFIKTRQFIPWNQAVQRAENQPVQGTPFSFLSKFGINTGSQLYNAESQFATNVIPIVGTFGHLAAHPNEDLGSKISDIAFGIADFLPFVGGAAALGRAADVGAEGALAGARAAEAGGEAASNISNALSKGGEILYRPKLSPQQLKQLFGPYWQIALKPGGEILPSGDILPWLRGAEEGGEELGSDLGNALSKEGEEAGSNLFNPLSKILGKGGGLRNTLIKVAKYGTPALFGIGLGVPLALSFLNQNQGNNQNPSPSSPSSPYHYLPNPSSPSSPSNWYNYPTGASGGNQYPNNNIGLYNPFSQGDQSQEAGTALQNLQGNAASQSPYNYPYPSSPSGPSSPYYSFSPSGSSSGGGFLSDLIHNKYFLIGAVVIVLIIIGIILMR
jgi:hypothetical protein